MLEAITALLLPASIIIGSIIIGSGISRVVKMLNQVAVALEEELAKIEREALEENVARRQPKSDGDPRIVAPRFEK